MGGDSPSGGIACGGERGGAPASAAAASERATRCGLRSTLTFVLQQTARWARGGREGPPLEAHYLLADVGRVGAVARHQRAPELVHLQ